MLLQSIIDARGERYPARVNAPAPHAGLRELAQVTASIARAQSKVNALAEKRKALIYRLDAEQVSRRDMAAAMGVTVQTVYRIAPAAEAPT